MKHRVIYICIIICVIFYSLTAFAAISTEKAQLLSSINLLKGTGKTFDLDKAFTRAQGAVVIVRLLGLEAEVMQVKPKLIFKDVKKEHWANKYVNYAYEKGIIRGTGPNTYSPNKEMNAKEFVTLVLRGLGHTDAIPSTALDIAVSTKLLDINWAGGLKIQYKFARHEMVSIMVQALKASIKGENKTLIQKLVDTNVISKEKAIFTGLYTENKEPVTTELKKPFSSTDAMDRIESAIQEALKK